jgi:putative addiction module component (TIGR02574 family)
MSGHAKELLKKALNLPVAERAELAGSLIESLDKDEDGQVNVAWEAEIERRMDEIDSGKVRAIPLEEARLADHGIESKTAP